MLNRNFVQPRFFLLIIFFIMAGCQTKLDMAGQEHKLVSDKWYALAQYADSKISHYGISVSARMSIEAGENGYVFKLSSFQFTDSVSNQEIDLLNPSFENKYLCNPECFQLLEFVELEQKSGATLLTDFFTAHEFELFQLYADLVILSDQIDSLVKLDTTLFTSYLKGLALNKKQFETTQSFSLFLEQALTQEAIIDFINTKSGANSAFLESFKIEPNQLWISAEQEENYEDYRGVERSWLQAEQATPDEIAMQEYNKNSNEDISDSLLSSPESMHWQLLSIDRSSEAILSWSQAKKIPILQGQNVCSFNQNYFGTVANNDEKEIEINLLGRAITMVDGMLRDFESGALFSNYTELEFIPEVGTKIFPIEDIATCYLE